MSGTLSTTPAEEAAALQTAGVRSADVLQTAGKREADVLMTAGQRRVNLLWEMTQSLIAVAVASTTLWVSGRLALIIGRDTTALALLSNAFFLVIGFYFGRTNHQRTGGVGSQDSGR